MENPMDRGAWWAAVHGVARSRTRLSNFTFTFHFHALEKEMATCSSVLAWRIPGTGEPGGLPSLGSDTTEATQQQEQQQVRMFSTGRHSMRTGSQYNYLSFHWRWGFGGQEWLHCFLTAIVKEREKNTHPLPGVATRRLVKKRWTLEKNNGILCIWLDSITDSTWHEFEQTPAHGGEQKSLDCYSPWDCKESDMT